MTRSRAKCRSAGLRRSVCANYSACNGKTKTAIYTGQEIFLASFAAFLRDRRPASEVAARQVGIAAGLRAGNHRHHPNLALSHRQPVERPNVLVPAGRGVSRGQAVSEVAVLKDGRKGKPGAPFLAHFARSGAFSPITNPSDANHTPLCEFPHLRQISAP